MEDTRNLIIHTEYGIKTYKGIYLFIYSVLKYNY